MQVVVGQSRNIRGRIMSSSVRLPTDEDKKNNTITSLCLGRHATLHKNIRHHTRPLACLGRESNSGPPVLEAHKHSLSTRPGRSLL